MKARARTFCRGRSSRCEPTGALWLALTVCLAFGAASCQERSEKTEGPPPGDEGVSIESGDTLGKAESLDKASTKSAGKVSASIKGAPSTWKSGGEHEVRLVLEIEDGWHLNAHPASLDYLIPTEFELQGDKAILESIFYPGGESFSLAQMDEPIKVYSGTVEIPMRIRLSKDLSPGKHALKGAVKVQACDDKRCLAPGSVPVELALNVKGE